MKTITTERPATGGRETPRQKQKVSRQPVASRLQILHLEDESTDAELAASMLKADGIDCDITRVETRGEFTASLEREEFKIILADYSLPSFDGLSALALRQEKCPGVPYIFLSGKLGEETAIAALRSGATDYVLKDNMARLAPAVRRAPQRVCLCVCVYPFAPVFVYVYVRVL